MRSFIRSIRDNPVSGALVRLPFERMRRAGARLPASVYRHLPQHGTFVARCGDESFLMHAAGDQLENTVYWRGALEWEPESIRLWHALARNAPVVLDIGANTGLYSLVAACANPSADVHAFEPLARIADRIRKNALLNPAMQISVHDCAVGETDGTAQIFDPGGANCYSASLNAEFLTDAVSKEAYDVKVVAIDSFVKDRLKRVDLIKLDVEGFEPQALRGMRDTLLRHKPSLFVEFVRDDSGELAKELNGLLEEGYSAYHLFESGPRPVSDVSAGGDGRNLLLARSELSLDAALAD